ncbi:MAG TPA: winged helix-turn-helix domain-containing protein [Pyrinomonadaceae bacterium]|nr:winged helix-turn-helix domain-containing protein [Pyrinomonadaceae bacterium]
MSAELGHAGVEGRGAELEGADVYDDGRLRVEHDNYYVALAGRPVRLPRKEFLLLSRLARNPERVVPSGELWGHAWPAGAAFNPESLHVHIYRLRRRLAPHGLRIESMVNVGYRLAAAAGVAG